MNSISINPACDVKMQQKPLMTAAMQQALHVMQLPILELSEWLLSEVEKNPVLEIVPKREMRRGTHTVSEPEVASTATLFHHLMAQAQCHFTEVRQLEIAEWLIGHLNEKGFLEVPLSELTTHASLKALEEVLAEIQTFDPPGVAARSVQEALLLQLKKHSEAYTIVEKHFDALLHNRFDTISRELQVPVERVAALVTQEIAPLDLHPGHRFAPHYTQAITPDLVLTCIGEMWKIEVNEGPLPSFRTADSYERAIEQGSLNSEERAYLRKALHTGKWIRRIVGKRHKTLMEIGRFLLQRQAGFFQEGKLTPMTLNDVAEQLELHESTIARAVAGKYLTCPQGTFALKDFFSQGVKAEAGSVSQHTLRRTLQQLIAKENKGKPYSDAQLQRQLNSAGIFCARRTVTKYRRLLRLASAAKRKHWVKN